MGARGTNLAEEGHIVPLINSVNISGGLIAQRFSMRGAAKANIIIQWGTLTAGQGTVFLQASPDITGSGAVNIAFDLYQQTASGVGNDVLGPRQSVPATGYTPSDTPNVVDVLHVQADYLPDGFAYLGLGLGDGTNTDYASAIAVLTGLRNGGVSNPSATV